MNHLLRAMIALGYVLSSLSGGMVVWAAIDAFMLFYGAGGDPLTRSQLLTLAIDSIQAGAFAMMVPAIRRVITGLRRRLAVQPN